MQAGLSHQAGAQTGSAAFKGSRRRHDMDLWKPFVELYNQGCRPRLKRTLAGQRRTSFQEGIEFFLSSLSSQAEKSARSPQGRDRMAEMIWLAYRVRYSAKPYLPTYLNSIPAQPTSAPGFQPPLVRFYELSLQSPPKPEHVGHRNGRKSCTLDRRAEYQRFAEAMIGQAPSPYYAL